MLSTRADSLAVLLVEDDSQLLRTLSDILRRRGYSTLTAATGREGVTLAQQSTVPPAVALVDLRLPDMDGLQVISHLRRVSQLTETVVLTGHASLDTAVQALREQSCDYLVKPIAPDQLFPIVERAGERWQRRMAEEALRVSEERYRLLLENISDVIAVVGPDHIMRYVSPSVMRMLGYAPAELVGTSGMLIRHPADEEAFQRFAAAVAAEAGASRTIDVRVRHRDGSWRLLEVSATNLLHRPEIAGLLYIVRDVTDRRRFETQLHQAQKMESIGSLAGGVAHDFNNVLGAIIGYGELIASEADLEDRTRADLGEMLSAAHRAGALTRQLLAFSRRQPSEPRVLDPNNLVENLLNMLRRMIGESVQLRTSLTPDAGAVRADPAQLEQVLMNLAVNARDAMPDGGTLTIATANVAIGRADARAGAELTPGEYVLLTVSDTGTGMTEEVKACAFEPFFTTKEPGRGTGLGLATCYGIVKQAAGHIALDTAPGAGTAVHVYLPRANAPVDAPVAKRTATDVEGRHETILVVDDEPAIRQLLRRVLARRGYEALDAGDAEGALALLDQHGARVRLLLTDVGLPGSSGVALAEAVRARWPAMRVLFMSGYDKGAGGPQPIGTSIQKPFKPAEILARIRAVLDEA